MSKEFIGLNRWQAMGIAWPGRVWETAGELDSNRERPTGWVRRWCGTRWERCAQRRQAGWWRKAGRELVRGCSCGVRPAGADGRRGWQSQRVLRRWRAGRSRERLDGEHESATADRALAQRGAGKLLEVVAIVGGRLGRGLGRGHAEQLSAEGEFGVAVAAGEETEMAYAMEGVRQDMHQEATDELRCGQRHRLEAVLLTVVLPAEADEAVLNGQDAVVGEGHAVGVATEVVEDAGGSVEGRLGVDDPLGLAQGPEVPVEGGGIGERGEGAGQVQAALAVGVFEGLEEEGAEAAREDADGQEEAGPAGDPAIALRGEAAAGDDAVQMGVEGKIRAPGMQDGEEADRGAEVLGVGGDLAQGAGCGAEEQGVECALVLQGDRGDRGGQREDDMEILAVQQFVPALGDPGGAGGALALGAVAVAAGTVAVAAVPAAVALLDLAAEGGGAAFLDGGHDTPLQGGQGMAATCAEGVPVVLEDIRDFESRAGHRAVRDATSAAGCGRGSRSSGLVAEHTLEQAICR